MAQTLEAERGERTATWATELLYPLRFWSFAKQIHGAFPLEVAKAIKDRRHFTDSEFETIRTIAGRNWTSEQLSLLNPDDINLAARAAALGGVLCYGFGNFYAVAAHPCRESVIHVNLSKGRPRDQVGSVTTTQERVHRIFDWSKVPVSRKAVMNLIDELYDMGPFGFRGPAAEGIDAHLTYRDGDRVTTQIIAPGYRCPSNRLLAKVLEISGEDFFFITSANMSHNITGNTEEPAHWKMKGIQKDFGDKSGFIMIAHEDEDSVVESFRPRYRPMSTSILAFHKVTYGRDGRPELFLERHGSLHIDDILEVVSRHGFGLQKGPKAESRLPERYYAD